MDSKTYWETREAEALKIYIKDEAEYSKELDRIYADMLDSIQKEIDSFYQKYAASQGITLAEAKKRVAKHDVKAFERRAARYVKDKDFSKKANEELKLYNATMRINRLEMLKANIGLETIKGHAELERFMEGILKGRTMEELERQAGILGKTVRDNAKMANAIVNGSFKVDKVGERTTFSDRIWQYHDEMKNELSRLLSTGLIQGKNSRAIAKDLKKYWYGADPKTGGGARYCMERLMRTEMARVQTEAQKQSFVRNGFDMYTFHANRGCCDLCSKKDGKHFSVKDMMPGENAPPMHPHCRCSTSAYEDSKEYEAWIDHLANGGITEQWNKIKYSAVKSKKPLENSGKDSKIEVEKIATFRELSEDLKERSKQVNRLLDSYSVRKSKWSGRTIVKDRDALVGVLGAKEWNCDITLRKDSGVKTAIHEHLHARSISHYTPKEYIRWNRIEEGAVELYAQEICKRNNIAYKGAYTEHVKNLRIINSILSEYDDYEYAQKLFEIDVVDRYSWLRKTANTLINKEVLSKKTTEALNAAIDYFA